MFDSVGKEALLIDRWTDESPGKGETSPLAHSGQDSPDAVPLAVDLDGTLVATDTLFESVSSLIRQSPSSLLLLAVWYFALGPGGSSSGTTNNTPTNNNGGAAATQQAPAATQQAPASLEAPASS